MEDELTKQEKKKIRFIMSDDLDVCDDWANEMFEYVAQIKSQAIQDATLAGARNNKIAGAELMLDILAKHGYIDSDYYTEKPTAMDLFLQELTPPQESNQPEE